MQTQRLRNEERQFLYGGYATWVDRSGKYHSHEIRVWGPRHWDTDYSNGDELFAALQKKALKLSKLAEVREAWRYS